MNRTGLIAVALSALLIAPSPALGGGAGISKDNPEQLVMVFAAGTTVVNGTVVTGMVVGSKPIQIVRGHGYVTTASGGGAGQYTSVNITDGTNSCQIYWECTTTNSTGVKVGTVSPQAGTGCVFAAGAVLTVIGNPSTCTTTQPIYRVINFFAKEL